MPTDLATLFCAQDDVLFFLSELGLALRLDDAGAGALEFDELDEAEQAFLTRACHYATERVKFYCAPHYDTADLATSWLVHEWATTIATHRVCLRRGNPVPEVVRELMFGDAKSGHKGVMGDLADVRAKNAAIPDVGYRNVPWPAWSNVRVDPRYRLRQIRVQRPISEGTPTQHAQDVDWPAEHSLEF